MELETTGTQETPRPGVTRSRLTTLVVIAVTGVLIGAVAYLSNQPTYATTTLPDGTTITTVSVAGAASGEPPVVGRPAPDFAAATADGTPIRLSELRGKPVWLTFGASWCQPCRAENPDIEATYEKYRAQGLVVVQVYITEDARTVTDYATRVGLTYTKVPDPAERIAGQYRILGIPSHFFIGRDGVLRVLRIGSLTPELIETNVQGILR